MIHFYAGQQDLSISQNVSGKTSAHLNSRKTQKQLSNVLNEQKGGISESQPQPTISSFKKPNQITDKNNVNVTKNAVKRQKRAQLEHNIQLSFLEENNLVNGEEIKNPKKKEDSQKLFGGYLNKKLMSKSGIFSPNETTKCRNDTDNSTYDQQNQRLTLEQIEFSQTLQRGYFSPQNAKISQPKDSFVFSQRSGSHNIAQNNDFLVKMQPNGPNQIETNPNMSMLLVEQQEITNDKSKHLNQSEMTNRNQKKQVGKRRNSRTKTALQNYSQKIGKEGLLYKQSKLAPQHQEEPFYQVNRGIATSKIITNYESYIAPKSKLIAVSSPTSQNHNHMMFQKQKQSLNKFVTDTFLSQKQAALSPLSSSLKFSLEKREKFSRRVKSPTNNLPSSQKQKIQSDPFFTTSYCLGKSRKHHKKSLLGTTTGPLLQQHLIQSPTQETVTTQQISSITSPKFKSLKPQQQLIESSRPMTVQDFRKSSFQKRSKQLALSPSRNVYIPSQNFLASQHLKQQQLNQKQNLEMQRKGKNGSSKFNVKKQLTVNNDQSSQISELIVDNQKIIPKILTTYEDKKAMLIEDRNFDELDQDILLSESQKNQIIGEEIQSKTYVLKSESEVIQDDDISNQQEQQNATIDLRIQPFDTLQQSDDKNDLDTSQDHDKLEEKIIHKNKETSPNQLIIDSDQAMTYFNKTTVERQNQQSHKLERTYNQRQHSGSFGKAIPKNEASPRATYYSPERNQSSQLKTLWMQDTGTISPQNANALLKKSPLSASRIESNTNWNSSSKVLRKQNSQKFQIFQAQSPQQLLNSSNQLKMDVDQSKDKEKQRDDRKFGALQKTNNDETLTFATKNHTDEYQIGDLIGSGAYASVYDGIHLKSKERRAFKIYFKEKIRDVNRQKSVGREISVMEKIDHPNVAKFYEAIETKDRVILVLEFVSGKSTHGYLKSKPDRRMTESESRLIMKQLLEALTYLHSLQITHRDIKLENLMLDQNQNLKLIDFGFSTQIPNSQKLRLFCGTPSYMAPEIVSKSEYTGPPVDIYAAGILLYVFSCGKFPFKRAENKELYLKIQTEQIMIPNFVSEQVSNLITKMVQKDPLQRPSAYELLNDSWITSTHFTSKPERQIQRERIDQSGSRSTSLKTRKVSSRHQQMQYIGYLQSPTNKILVPNLQKSSNQSGQFSRNRPQYEMTGFTDQNRNLTKMASYLNQPLNSKTLTDNRNLLTAQSFGIHSTIAANPKQRKESLALIDQVNKKLEDVYRSKQSPVANLKVKKLQVRSPQLKTKKHSVTPTSQFYFQGNPMAFQDTTSPSNKVNKEVRIQHESTTKARQKGLTIDQMQNKIVTLQKPEFQTKLTNGNIQMNQKKFTVQNPRIQVSTRNHDNQIKMKTADQIQKSQHDSSTVQQKRNLKQTTLEANYLQKQGFFATSQVQDRQIPNQSIKRDKLTVKQQKVETLSDCGHKLNDEAYNAYYTSSPNAQQHQYLNNLRTTFSDKKSEPQFLSQEISSEISQYETLPNTIIPLSKLQQVNKQNEFTIEGGISKERGDQDLSPSSNHKTSNQTSQQGNQQKQIVKTQKKLHNNQIEHYKLIQNDDIDYRQKIKHRNMNQKVDVNFGKHKNKDDSVYQPTGKQKINGLRSDIMHVKGVQLSPMAATLKIIKDLNR